jgi:hypothetical protein
MDVQQIVHGLMSAEGCHWRIHKALTKYLSPNAALFLAVLIDKENYWIRKKRLENGWFYKKASEFEEEIGLSEHQQRTVKELLIEKHLLETELRQIDTTDKRAGVQTYFRLNHNNLLKLHEEWLSFKKKESDIVEPANPEKFTSSFLGCAPQITAGAHLQKLEGTTTSINYNPISPKNRQEETSKQIELKKEVKVPEKPSIKLILRSWKSSLPDRPSWEERRSLLENLFATLKTNGYSEQDLPVSFKEEALRSWMPTKSGKNTDHMIAKCNEDYDVALIQISPSVQITEAVSQIKTKTSPSKTMGEIDLDVAIAMTMEDDELQKLMDEYIKNTTNNEG